MKTLRFFIFVFFFSIDVTVRAATLGLLKAPVEEPRNCLRRFEICVVGTYKNSKYELNVASTKITLGSDTSLARLEIGRFQLLAGEVWVRAEDEITVESEYGQVTVYKGEALISRENKNLMVRNLKGTVKILDKNGSSLDVERGFENSLGPVGRAGHSRTSIPQVIDRRELIQTLGSLFVGDKRSFRSFTGEIFKGWPTIVEGASEFHSQFAQRSIAAENEAIEKARRRREALETERRRINQLYRSKTLDNY